MTSHILVVDDDPLMLRLVAGGLQFIGMSCKECEDGASAMLAVRKQEFDALVLDRNLGGSDGIGLLRNLRDLGSRAPAMFLSAKTSTSDRVDGLNAGADDYLIKPFEMDELIARVRALVRRPKAMVAEILSAGPLTLDTTLQTVTVSDVQINLTAQDIALLTVFLRHPNRVFTRETLLEKIGAPDTTSRSAADSAVSRLRKKLCAAGAPSIIETAQGIGYRLSAIAT